MHPALRKGTLERLPLPKPLIGFERRLGSDRVLLVFNPSTEDARAILPRGEWRPFDGEGVRIDGRDAALAPFGFVAAALEPAMAL